jgi:predicted RNA-binding protein YlxR (DUF448 family)
VMSDRATSGQGNRRSADEPLRQCAVSRAHAEPNELIRFVAGPEGQIVPDLARRLPGRGVWVGATRDLVRTAIQRKVFSRSLKQPVSVADDLDQLIERLMARRLAEAISLANKAGLLVTGFAKVEERLDKGQVTVLIHASDGAPGGATKLDRKFQASAGPEIFEQAVVKELTGPELDLAIGRSNVVHAAASEGGASLRILQEAARLRRYRSGEPPIAPVLNTGRV